MPCRSYIRFILPNMGAAFLFLLFFSLNSYSATQSVALACASSGINSGNCCTEYGCGGLLVHLEPTVNFATSYGTYYLTCGGMGMPTNRHQVTLPSGATNIKVIPTPPINGFNVACSPTEQPYGGNDNDYLSLHCSSCGIVSGSASGFITITYESNTLPPCRQPTPTDDPLCKDGEGLRFQANDLEAANLIAGMFGAYNDVVRVFWNPVIPPPTSDTLDYNGRLCTLGGAAGTVYDFLVCPNGAADEPSSSSAEENSSSSSAEGNSSDSGDGDNGNHSSGSGLGGDCEHLSNCDWAKLEIQLIQLGVEKEIRDKIGEAVGLLGLGYNLTKEQNELLQGVIDGISGLDSLINSTSDGGDWENDLDGLMNSFGNGDSTMGDILGDGTKFRGRIERSVGIDSGSFTFFGNSDDCPVFDFTFDTGVMGIKCTKPMCKLNLCNTYGTNIAAIIRAVLWLMVIFACLYYDLQVIRSGGNS